MSVETLERSVTYADSTTKERERESVDPMDARLLVGMIDKRFLNPDLHINPQELQKSQRTLADKTYQDIDYDPLRQLSKQDRFTYWRERRAEEKRQAELEGRRYKPKSQKEQKKEWQEGICNWIEDMMDHRPKDRHEFAATLAAVGIEIKDKSSRSIRKQVDTFYDDYLTQEDGIDRFIEAIAAKQGTRDLEQLEHKLMLVRGLVISFGKKESTRELVDAFTRNRKRLAGRQSLDISAANDLNRAQREHMRALYEATQQPRTVYEADEFEEPEEIFENKQPQLKKEKRRYGRKLAEKAKSLYGRMKPKKSVVHFGIAAVLAGGFSATAIKMNSGEYTEQIGQSISHIFEQKTEQREVSAQLAQQLQEHAQESANEVREGSADLGDILDEAYQKGAITTKQKDNKIYEPTFFGYSSEEQVTSGQYDSEDNHTFKYEDQVRQQIIEKGLSKVDKETKEVKPLDVEGKSEAELQKEIQWFSAGAGGQFGEPGGLVLVTGEDGKQVVVLVGDEGPARKVQMRDEKAKFDMSWDAYNYLGDPSKVKAESLDDVELANGVKIPDWLKKQLPLGPVDVGAIAEIAAQHAPVSAQKPKETQLAPLGRPNELGYYLLPQAKDGSYEFKQPHCTAEHKGSKTLVRVIQQVARDWKKEYPKGYLKIGDLNAKYDHVSHKHGVDFDLSATTDGKDSVANMKGDHYNKEATIELARLLNDTGKIKFIFYNDEDVQAVINRAPGASKGMEMQTVENHENHFHVRIKDKYRKTFYAPVCRVKN